MITNFCCIEGWSTVAYWTGARFSDFTKKIFSARRGAAELCLHDHTGRGLLCRPGYEERTASANTARLSRKTENRSTAEQARRSA